MVGGRERINKSFLNLLPGGGDTDKRERERERIIQPDRHREGEGRKDGLSCVFTILVVLSNSMHV